MTNRLHPQLTDAAAGGSSGGSGLGNGLDVDAGALRLARGFAVQVERWSRALGAGAADAQAAARSAEAVSLATSAGHSCTDLATVAAAVGIDARELHKRLLASAVVTTPAQRAALPLVLDDEGRLYLHRYFDYEQRLAERLLVSARAPIEPAAPQTARRLAELFPPASTREADAPDWQRVAAALALTRRFAVVSGGPGTGKTTTVVHVLACVLEQQPGCRIALAAPTGKAAARMMEAIGARAAALPEALSARLPAEAQTVHRLLGVDGRGGGFRHHAAHRLPIDVLVVDEASMLDLALATQLLEAVPDEARIILLGDKDQLAAVEAGSVFAEASADPSLDAATRDALAALAGVPASAIHPPEAGERTSLANSVVWFTETHRFAGGSGIAALAAAVRRGDVAAAAVLMRQGGDDGSLLSLEGDAALTAHVGEGYAPFVEAVRTRPTDVAAVMRAFDAFRVLCAVRGGPRGVAAINREGERAMRAALAKAPSLPTAGPLWYAGRPVMVTRNDHGLRLFNGDVGIALPDVEGPGGRLLVHFPGPGGTFRAIAPARLPEHETAFATTVHKAQGSEFDRVVVVLPAQASPVLTRELLYTAVTRARRHVALAASPEMLRLAVETPTRRHSGLLARLREAAGAVEVGGANSPATR